jgi:hypothetical protein
MTQQPQQSQARPLRSRMAAIRATPREDAIWNRPVFRPPPLEVQPARPELPYLDTIQRTELWAPWPRESTPCR